MLPGRRGQAWQTTRVHTGSSLFLEFSGHNILQLSIERVQYEASSYSPACTILGPFLTISRPILHLTSSFRRLWNKSRFESGPEYLGSNPGSDIYFSLKCPYPNKKEVGSEPISAALLRSCSASVAVVLSTNPAENSLKWILESDFFNHQVDIELSFTHREGIEDIIEQLLKASWPKNFSAIQTPFLKMRYEGKKHLFTLHKKWVSSSSWWHWSFT